MNLTQARVITDALAALPEDLGEDLLAKAETLMVTEANHLGPRELRTLGLTTSYVAVAITTTSYDVLKRSV